MKADVLRNLRKLTGHHPGTMARAVAREWCIYIPEEGHWPIKGKHKSEAEAKAAYLKWARRKTLPKGAYIVDAPYT